MPNLNSVILIGNLTQDPDLRFTPKGTAVGNLNLAINETFKSADGTSKEQVIYIDIEVWGRQAETCKQYLTKGKSICIEGALKLDQWEQDGQKRSKLRVRANRVQFLSAPDKRNSAQSTPTKTDEPSMPSSDDDIPF